MKHLIYHTPTIVPTAKRDLKPGRVLRPFSPIRPGPDRIAGLAPEPVTGPGRVYGMLSAGCPVFRARIT